MPLENRQSTIAKSNQVPDENITKWFVCLLYFHVFAQYPHDTKCNMSQISIHKISYQFFLNLYKELDIVHALVHLCSLSNGPDMNNGTINNCLSHFLVKMIIKCIHVHCYFN
jgi:hypothetical protein